MPTLRLDKARATGDFGITLDDTVAIHNTNVRFSGVETRTLEQLIPNFASPRRGVFSGRATVTGGRPRAGARWRRDVRRRERRQEPGDRGGTTSRFPGRSVRATNLRVQMLPVQRGHGAHVDAIAADQR